MTQIGKFASLDSIQQQVNKSNNEIRQPYVLFKGEPDKISLKSKELKKKGLRKYLATMGAFIAGLAIWNHKDTNKTSKNSEKLVK